MVRKSVKVNVSQDSEARPVAVLVQIASQYDSRIFLLSEDKKINAKSIMGMMSLGLIQGEELTVEAEGDDEGKAVEHIEKFLCDIK